MQHTFGLRQRVGVFLGPALFVALGLGLRATGLKAEACWAAATVFLMATWWITEPLPLWATACLPLVLFPLFGAARFPDVLVQYFDPVNFLFLGGMMIAACMEQSGLHRRIALGIVARIGTSPRRIVLGFMLATGFITLWISNTAAALMMFPIGMAVLQKFEEQHAPHDPLLRRFGLALMLGIAYAASIGGIGTKIGTGTNFVFVKQASQVMTQEVTFLTWLKVGMPIVLIAIPVVWFYLVRVVARLPAEEFRGGRQAIHDARAQLGVMKRGEVLALIAFLMAAFLWTFRQDIDLGAVKIPGWAGFIPWSWADVVGRPVAELPKVLADLLGPRGADSVVAIIIGGALLLVPLQFKPIRCALDVRRVGHIGWDLLVLLGGGFAMAHGIQSSGLSDAIAGTLKGLGHFNPFLVMLVVCLVTTAISEVASNTATASILLPLLAASAQDFGMQPAPLMFAATLAASFGFMLPAGTPPNAIVHSSGYIPVTQMARSGLAVDLFGAVLITTVCYYIAPWALGTR